MVDDAELVDEVLASYAHLAPEQRARIQKLTNRGGIVEEEDPFLVNHVNHSSENKESVGEIEKDGGR